MPSLVALPLALATVASYLGTWWWGLALVANFRPHLAVASLISLGVALLWRARFSSALSLILLASNSVPLLPYMAIFGHVEAGRPANLRVLAYNMHGPATDRAAFRDVIRSERPDL